MSKDTRIYELNLDGFVIKNRTLQELIAIVKVNAGMPYDLYEIKQSKMNIPGFIPSNLSDSQIQRIKEQYSRGYSMRTLGHKYGTSENTISRVIKNEKLATQ